MVCDFVSDLGFKMGIQTEGFASRIHVLGIGVTVICLADLLRNN